MGGVVHGDAPGSDSGHPDGAGGAGGSAADADHVPAVSSRGVLAEGGDAGAAGDVGDAGWRTGEIGLDVKPKDARLELPGEVWLSSAGVSGWAVSGSAPPNHAGSAASGRAGGRR
ncbi:hypothetical protein [Actinoplanes solisilvae]|uniref:hypothetical protein n=1 Tax=Actinoplanes solisilvae TaxID=2486853 RepID=UPI000FD90A0D|nr:hypothetical protein [Actinoplanes solisilvae]